MKSPSRVLIVDDSESMRRLLTQIIDSDPLLTVVGTAGDAFEAREKIKALNPDVLTLDIEMPKMDGLTFLEKLMRGHPMPVIMISSFTERGAQTTLRALSLGAIDYISKPKVDVTTGTVEQADEIIAKIKTAAKVRVQAPTNAQVASWGMVAEKPAEAVAVKPSAAQKVIAFGASTGGTEALKDVLMTLPAGFPGIVMVQHMPEAFTRAFAARLDSLCRIHVREAQDGDRILPGLALLAPGGHQMEIVRAGVEYFARVYRGERVNRHLPSVDVLFSSCARHLGSNGVGVLLTGMGDDGAKGLMQMKQAAAHTIAQDEASCVVFGMPREAILLGAVAQVLPLQKISATLLQRLAVA